MIFKSCSSQSLTKIRGLVLLGLSVFFFQAFFLSCVEAKKDHPRALYYSFTFSLEDSKSKAFLNRYARDRIKKAGYLLLESRTEKLLDSEKPPRELSISISKDSGSKDEKNGSVFSLKVALKNSRADRLEEFRAQEELAKPLFKPSKGGNRRLTQKSLLYLQMSLDKLLQKALRALDTGRLNS
jgi:hypothetical protein